MTIWREDEAIEWTRSAVALERYIVEVAHLRVRILRVGECVNVLDAVIHSNNQHETWHLYEVGDVMKGHVDSET